MTKNATGANVVRLRGILGAVPVLAAVVLGGCCLFQSKPVGAVRPDNPNDGGLVGSLSNGNFEVTAGFILRSYQWKQCCEGKTP